MQCIKSFSNISDPVDCILGDGEVPLLTSIRLVLAVPGHAHGVYPALFLDCIPGNTVVTTRSRGVNDLGSGQAYRVEYHPQIHGITFSQ